LQNWRRNAVALNEQLERLRGQKAWALVCGSDSSITINSTPSEKITLFRRLFGGRSEVFPVRWENRNTGKSGYAPACANEWIRGVCGKPEVKCGECPNQAFIPMSDNAIANHLRGTDPDRSSNADFVAGVYTVRVDETCWFLAVDFDGDDWSADALAYLETCRLNSVPAALERSRSGKGGHAWIFFSQPIPARDARHLGAILLTDTLQRRPEVGFASYDRMFPSQDTLPKGGFGNLIALPLQRRARDYGNSVFVDENLLPHRDQWAFLSSLSRLAPQAVHDFIRQAEARDGVLGVRMPVAEENGDEPWRQPPSLRHSPDRVTEPLPDRVKIVLSDDIYIDRSALPPSMVAVLIRLAAFQNPEFYRAQVMRLPTFGKPRIISCASLHRNHLALPRGCFEETLELLRSHGIEVDIEDLRETGANLDYRFLGTLRCCCGRQYSHRRRAKSPGDSMASEVQMIGYELIKTGSLVSFRIVEQEVLAAPDEAEFGMRLLLRFVSGEGEDDQDEDDVAEDTVEWGAFGFMFVLGMLSFAEARPRNMSSVDYHEKDEFTVADFIEGLRFVRGELHFDADYIRGRRIKTRNAVRANGTVRLETTGRGNAVLRWLERLQGKKLLQLVGE
jgi:hypothetical protein